MAGVSIEARRGRHSRFTGARARTVEVREELSHRAGILRRRHDLREHHEPAHSAAGHVKVLRAALAAPSSPQPAERGGGSSLHAECAAQVAAAAAPLLLEEGLGVADPGQREAAAVLLEVPLGGDCPGVEAAAGGGRGGSGRDGAAVGAAGPSGAGRARSQTMRCRASQLLRQREQRRWSRPGETMRRVQSHFRRWQCRRAPVCSLLPAKPAFRLHRPLPPQPALWSPRPAGPGPSASRPPALLVRLLRPDRGPAASPAGPPPETRDLPVSPDRRGARVAGGARATCVILIDPDGAQRDDFDIIVIELSSAVSFRVYRNCDRVSRNFTCYQIAGRRRRSTENPCFSVWRRCMKDPYL